MGVCLKHLPSPWAGSNNNNSNNKNREARFHSGNVPWQRVINAKGAISPRSASSSGGWLLPGYIMIFADGQTEGRGRQGGRRKRCGERASWSS